MSQKLLPFRRSPKRFLEVSIRLAYYTRAEGSSEEYRVNAMQILRAPSGQELISAFGQVEAATTFAKAYSYALEKAFAAIRSNAAECAFIKIPSLPAGKQILAVMVKDSWDYKKALEYIGEA